MFKQIALLALLSLSSTVLLAQDVEKGSNKKTIVEKPSRDFVMFQLNYEAWMKPDSVKTSGIGRGVNVYLCYDFPIKKSNFSFAAGIGIGTANIYLDNQKINVTRDTGLYSDQATFEADTKYKRYKLTTAYLEAPFELRFFGNKENRNKGFKMAAGLRVGTLVGAHTKGKYDGIKISDKVNTKRYLETWRFAATARIGWGNFSIMGTYNLTNLYKENTGPEITPYSLGICLTGL